MADVLTTTLSFFMNTSWVDTQDLGTIIDAQLMNLDDTLADGVGLDQADLIFEDQRTLTATSETLDLTALTRTVYGSTNTITFAKIKCLLIKNTNTTAANALLVGAAAATAWEAWTSVAGSKMRVQPNGILFLWAPDLAAWVVDGTHKSLKIDAGASTIVYNILLIGTSA